MIVFDTNVVSELMRPRPDTAALRWLDTVPRSRVHITPVTIAELVKGVLRLPEGRRREEVRQTVDEALLRYDGRVLDIDARCGPYFADIVTSRESAGRPVSAMDAWIAAVCRRHDVPLATRNVKDFEGTGIALVNPWEPA